MDGSPSSPAQLVARGVGGEPAQNAAGVVESLAELNGAKTGLEITKAAVETADAEKSLIDSLNEANKEKNHHATNDSDSISRRLNRRRALGRQWHHDAHALHQETAREKRNEAGLCCDDDNWLRSNFVEPNVLAGEVEQVKQPSGFSVRMTVIGRRRMPGSTMRATS